MTRYNGRRGPAPTPVHRMRHLPVAAAAAADPIVVPPPPVSPRRTLAVALALAVAWTGVAALDVAQRASDLFGTSAVAPPEYACAAPWPWCVLALVATVHLLAVWPSGPHAVLYVAAVGGTVGLGLVDDDSVTSDGVRFAWSVVTALVQVTVTVTVPWDKFFTWCGGGGDGGAGAANAVSAPPSPPFATVVDVPPGSHPRPPPPPRRDNNALHRV